METSSKTFEFQEGLAFAQALDAQDPLRGFRDRYYFPQVHGQPALYFCGNSLGLQPKSTAAYLQRALDSWAAKAVDGHFYGEDAWYHIRKLSKPALAALTGAEEHEVVAMNNLTTNLHLLLVSFFRPAGKRVKIITEAGAFPSDYYVLETQLRYHGLDPDTCLVELQPREGEQTLRTEDIEAKILEIGDELALVMMAGIQYYTGQLFDMQRITAAAHAVGALAGFDLAHAIGNAPLALHEWGVDFATWCSYKYLNSGPGNVSGIYVHERWAESPELPRFGGWWGHDEGERFKMEKGFQPMLGADGWQLANSNVLALYAHQAALDLFMEAGISRLREKSEQLTAYLAFCLGKIGALKEWVSIITPAEREARGCQLSLQVKKGGKALFDALYARGVVGDWRHPDVIRIAPTPMYNQYEEVYRFALLLEEELKRFA